MTLLQSNSRRGALVGALACALLANASCSFDVRPQVRDTAMQPSAAAAQRRQDASAPDVAADTAAAMPAISTPALGDAGAALSGSTPAASAAGSTSSAAGAPAVQPAVQDAGSPEKPAPKPTEQAMKPPAQDAGEPQKPEVKPPAPMTPPAAGDAGKLPEPDAGMPAKPLLCKPGVYSGTFTGMIQLLGLTFSSVNGTVRAQLKPSVADRLDIVDGKVFGVDPDGNQLTVDLYGRVNCSTNNLEDGRLEHGIFHNQAANSDTPFVGTAQAVYSTEPHSLVGTFSVQANDVSLLTGKGTWSIISGQ